MLVFLPRPSSTLYILPSILYGVLHGVALGLSLVSFYSYISMLQFLWTRRSGGSPPRLWSSPPTLRRSQVVLILAVFCVVSIFLQSSPNARATIRAWLPWTPRPRPPGLILEPDGTGSYDWHTKSSFDPVRVGDVSEKDAGEACSAFPSHLLERIQPVLKTGHKVRD